MKKKIQKMEDICKNCKRLKKEGIYITQKKLKYEHNYCKNNWFHCGDDCCGRCTHCDK